MAINRNKMEVDAPSSHPNKTNNNTAISNKPIPRLEDLAFTALLRSSVIAQMPPNTQEPDKIIVSVKNSSHDITQYEIPKEDKVSYNTLMMFKAKNDPSVLLQFIANANPLAVKFLLQENPSLAATARGTVTTCSGYTYENVSAIELAYLMDDDEMMREVMLPAIQKLSPEMIKEADKQLANKMKEIEDQQKQFKPYDFSEIVKAIAADQTLRSSGKPNEATQKALEKLKTDFIPGVIKQGKSCIKEQLQECLRLYDQNFDPWKATQLRWYLINVYGHLQTLVEKCFEQECSQGLDEILNQKKSNARGVKIKNWIDEKALTYRGAADSSLLLGRDFFVEIIYGRVLGRTEVVVLRALLKNHVEQKHQQWEILSGDLAKPCINNQLSNKA